ncbi:MAG: DNA-directed RNA polymerase subunit alpha, partial [Alphaproteobacteria bacterium]|nr:DNA-directed RNA polymerase subunit alpha [Alphaproteobacteria bacterium]
MAILSKNWQALIKPEKLDIVPAKSASKQATIVAEPLERGFATTLGNVLRRVLLSSLQGAAVTTVKIDNVLHEFSSIHGVREDVTDIILNIKMLAIRAHSTDKKRMYLKATGPCEVTAGMIETGSDLEIINKDLVLCTLDKGATLNMEFTVETGKGYIPAAQNRPNDAPIGLIPIDSLFSPVKKVAYKVENSRVGQVTDYDKLSLTVETDGTVTPEDAVALAARIIQDQLQLFINFEDVQSEDRTQDREELKFNPNLLKKVDELELSVRSANCLKNDNI